MEETFFRFNTATGQFESIDAPAAFNQQRGGILFGAPDVDTPTKTEPMIVQIAGWVRQARLDPCPHCGGTGKRRVEEPDTA
jgi:hypothetical protein